MAFHLLLSVGKSHLLFYCMAMPNEGIFLKLGRLDARVQSSIGLTSWQLAMRISGIASACRNAGLPVDFHEIRDWLSGVTMPPRYLIGLDDPLRVPTVTYFYLRAMNCTTSCTNDEGAAVLRKIFDARREAIEWASEEVAYYEHLFETLSAAVPELNVQPTVSSVADALSELLQLAQITDERENIQNDSRFISQRTRPALVWLVSLFTPAVLVRSELTENLMPQMIPSLRFLDLRREQVLQSAITMLGSSVVTGQSALAKIESYLLSVRKNLLTNRRSNTWDAAIISAALPDIRRARLAAALNVQPQGAGYIKSRLFGKSKFG